MVRTSPWLNYGIGIDLTCSLSVPSFTITPRPSLPELFLPCCQGLMVLLIYVSSAVHPRDDPRNHLF